MAEVLVASQLRSGRASSNPHSFLGRGVALLVLDVVAALAAFGFTLWVVDGLASIQPGFGALAAGLVLPLIPAIAVGLVLVAGVMFELTTTARFASSDAVNWLPLRPIEYVLASTFAIAFSYSLSLALALGAGAAIAVATGEYLTYLLAAGLGVLGLLEGGFLIEMIRAVTQRVSAVVAGRAARVSLALRIVGVLVMLLALQFAFNPVLLYDVVGTSGLNGTWTAVIPILWGTHSVEAAGRGDLLSGAVFAAATVALSALLLAAAVRLRARYWNPVAPELKLSPHEYGASHPWLRRFGFGPLEASLVGKDLQGLLRRREMTPFLLLPLVLGAVGLLGLDPGAGPSSVPGAVLWGGMVAGLFALFLSTTSLGQERRGVLNLYANPVPPRSVFRAKAGLVLLLAGTFAVVLTGAVSLRMGLDLPTTIGTGASALAAVAESTFLGLAFAARYSDFQERPRPQYLRPTAMLAASLGGMFVLLLTVGPLAFAIGDPALGAIGLDFLLFGALLATVVIGLGFWSARRGVDRLFAEMPS